MPSPISRRSPKGTDVPTNRRTHIYPFVLSYRLAHRYAAHGHRDMRSSATLKALSASARRRGSYVASNCVTIAYAMGWGLRHLHTLMAISHFPKFSRTHGPMHPHLLSYIFRQANGPAPFGRPARKTLRVSPRRRGGYATSHCLGQEKKIVCFRFPDQP